MAFVQLRETKRVNQFERLKKRTDFVAAASGRRFHTERMSVQGRRRDDDGGVRIGLTVTKRVGHATERTRIKRRLREATKIAMARMAETGFPGIGTQTPGPVDTAPARNIPAENAVDREVSPAAACDGAEVRVDADIVVIGRRPVLTAEFEVLIEDFVRAVHNVTKPGQPKVRPGQRSKLAGASHPQRGRATQASHSS